MSNLSFVNTRRGVALATPVRSTSMKLLIPLLAALSDRKSVV